MIKRPLTTCLSSLCVFLLISACGRGDDLVAPHSANDQTQNAGDGDHWYPIDSKTPGHLCTKSDPDFDEQRYPEQIPHCARKVSHATRVKVSQPYGVSEDELDAYQVDHLLPLGLGGSNSEKNLWPVPYAQARKKAEFEFETFNQLKDGKITQREAISRIRVWVRDNLFSNPT